MGILALLEREDRNKRCEPVVACTRQNVSFLCRGTIPCQPGHGGISMTSKGHQHICMPSQTYQMVKTTDNYGMDVRRTRETSRLCGNTEPTKSQEYPAQEIP